MLILEWIGIGAAVLLVALLVVVVRRAVLFRSGGIIKLNLRVSTVIPGRGWSPGFGRFVGDELRWYRLFSFATRPKRVLSRKDLTIESRRSPEGQERLVMPADWMILRLTSHHAPVEVAMAPSTMTGFQYWLESSPPGPLSHRLATP